MNARFSTLTNGWKVHATGDVLVAGVGGPVREIRGGEGHAVDAPGRAVSGSDAPFVRAIANVERVGRDGDDRRARGLPWLVSVAEHLAGGRGTDGAGRAPAWRWRARPPCRGRTRSRARGPSSA